jgi:hypothetical protein
MIDIKGFGIWLLAFVLKTILSPFLFVYSIGIAAKEKRIGDYFYELGRGLDIAANKTLEPFLNKYFKIKKGHRFGGDNTISYDMAINKRYNWSTKLADRVEKIINKVDKNHLDKTLKKHELN